VMAMIRHHEPGSSDEEKLARNVMAWVRPRCRSLPADRRAAVMARLGREFEARFGRPLTDTD
jgi:hypothetical protein